MEPKEREEYIRPMKVDEFFVCQKIGEGYGGFVYQCKRGQNKYAMKLINPSNGKPRQYNEEMLIHEANVLETLKGHRNIVEYVKHSQKGQGVFLSKQNGVYSQPIAYLVMQLAEGGTLGDYFLHDRSHKFSEDLCRYFFQQFISAIEYIHGKGLTHRDIKLDNILLTEKYELLLADFGFSNVVNGVTGNGLVEGGKGTDGHKAPEVEEGKEFRGEPADIFAGAVSFFALRFKFLPFGISNILSSPAYNTFVVKPHQFWASCRGLLSNDDSISEGFENLWTNMFALDSIKRAKIAQIKQDPWFNQPAMKSEDVVRELQQRVPYVKSNIVQNNKNSKDMKEKGQLRGGSSHATQYTPHRDSEMAAISLQELLIFQNEIAKALFAVKHSHQPPAYHDSSSFRLLNHYSPFSPDDLFRVVAALAHNIDDTTLVDPETFTVRLEKPQKSGRVTLEMGVFFTEEASVIRFLKIEGDYLEYLDAIEEIKEEIEKLESQLFQ